MKKFVVTFYGYNDDRIESYQMESSKDCVAVFRALMKHDKQFADAYAEFLTECNTDLGNVADIREFAHEVYKIAVMEID